MTKEISTKGKKKKKKVKKVNPVMLYLRNHKNGVGIITGFFFASLSLFTIASIVSYLFTWADDQSLLSNSMIMDTLVSANNQGGKIGFIWANFLFSKLFGVGSFIVPFFFAAVSVFCFRIKSIKILRLFFLSIMGCIVISMFFSYIFYFTDLTSLFGDGIGGSYGYYINKWLISMVGALGTGFIVALIFLVWLLLLNNTIADRIINWFNKLFKEQQAINDIENEEDDDFEDDSEEESEEDEEDEEEENFDSFDGSDLELEPIDDDANGDVQFEIYEDNNGDTEKVNGEIPMDFNPISEIPIPSFEVEDNPQEVLTDKEWTERYDPRLSLSNYKFPTTSLLEDYTDMTYEVTRAELEMNNKKIVRTLKDYKIDISKITAKIGPTVTLYEIVPAPGVRVSQIKRLEEDIALSLAARGVRVVTLLGTNAIGIEVANEKPSVVSMKSVLEDPKFRNSKFDLPIVLGKTISNEVMTFDLAKMPHLLVAGATGQGKSVGLNAIITSLLYKKHPSELKFILVDPKKVELSLYEPIKNHYLAKLPDEDEAIITDTQKVIHTLKSLCILMDSRYDKLKAASVRNVKEYNEKFLSRKLNPNKGHDFMPYIVVVIDEFADLLMTAGREVEEPIARLAQLARAIGIHLVIATQRPTTNIITGTIKANFPARIAFKVFSSVDSKIILDQTGAKQLIGRGDMLITIGSDLVRVQCAFIDTPEVDAITKFVSKQQSFGGSYLLPEYVPEDSDKGATIIKSGERDDLFEEAARLIVREQQGSTSLIQRKMNLGYNRAGRIMDQLEDAGIVGPSEGSKARQVRITSLESLELILSSLD